MRDFENRGNRGATQADSSSSNLSQPARPFQPRGDVNDRCGGCTGGGGPIQKKDNGEQRENTTGLPDDVLQKAERDHKTDPVRKEKQDNTSPVVQLTKGKSKTSWNMAKVRLYKKYLRARAAKRKEKGKKKNTNKLLRKYINARRRVDPKWVPKLADAPSAGHHAPPLAVSNNQGQAFAFGPRGSTKEKARDRLYLEGDKKKRERQHAMMHEAEGLQGVNRSGKYKGDDRQLASDMMLAHEGLQDMDRTPLTAAVLSQHDRESGGTGPQVPLGKATRKIVEQQTSMKMDDVESDTTSSSPTSNESDWKIDSDDD